jgi:O-phosphoseryl-tRNA(Cys) synthetase
MISDKMAEQFKELFSSYHAGQIDVYDLVDYLEQVINEEEED